MAAGTLASRGSGLVRLVATAWALGALGTADAYNAANATPNMVYDLVLGGVLSATLVPVLIRWRADGGDDDDAADAILTVGGIVLVAATALLIVGAPWVMGAYTSLARASVAPQNLAAAITLLRYFAPQVLCYGLLALLTGILNTRDRFAAPMWAPVVNNVVVTVVLLVTGLAIHGHAPGHTPSAALIAFLGLGTTAGVVAQLAAVIPAARSVGVRFAWRPQFRHPALTSMARLSTWTVGIVLTNQAALFAVIVLSFPTRGGISAYTYAYTFFQLPYAVIAVSLITARAPVWAHMSAGSELAALSRSVGATLRTMLGMILPLAAVLVVVAVPAIALVLGHGAASGATELTGRVLRVLVVGLPGFCVFLAAVRALQSMQLMRAALRLYLIENSVNVVGAIIGAKIDGVVGVAASISLAYTLGAVLAVRRLSRETGEPIWQRRVRQPVIRVAVGAGAGLIVGAAIAQRLPVGGVLDDVVSCVVGGAVVGAVTIAVAVTWAAISPPGSAPRSRRTPPPSTPSPFGPQVVTEDYPSARSARGWSSSGR